MKLIDAVSQCSSAEPLCTRTPPPAPPPLSKPTRTWRPPPPTSPPPNHSKKRPPPPPSPAHQSHKQDSVEVHSRKRLKTSQVCFKAQPAKERTGSQPQYWNTGAICLNPKKAVSVGSYLKVQQERDQARGQVEALEEKVLALQHNIKFRDNNPGLKYCQLSSCHDTLTAEYEQLKSHLTASRKIHVDKYTAMKNEIERLYRKKAFLHLKERHGYFADVYLQMLHAENKRLSEAMDITRKVYRHLVRKRRI